MTPGERAAMSTPRPPREIADAEVEFVNNEALVGRVMVMFPGSLPARSWASPVAEGLGWERGWARPSYDSQPTVAYCSRA